ncbi:MAG: hypothetical protein ACLGIA_08055, partial [Actinomycetes bacterium]
MDQAAALLVLLVGVIVAGLIIWLARREASALHRRAMAEIDEAHGRVATAQAEAAALLADGRTEREAALTDVRTREQRLEARESRLAKQLERLEQDQREHEQTRAAELKDLSERRTRLGEKEQSKLATWAEEDRRRAASDAEHR